MANAITPRERVRTALQHKQPDATPHNVGFTVRAQEKLAAYVQDPEYLDKLGNHLCGLSPATPNAWEEVKPGYWRDEFGVVWNRNVDRDIGMVEIFLLEDPASLDSYEFPDPHLPERFAHYPATLAQNQHLYLTQNIGFSLFERAWTLRGMENLLVDMVERPSFVEELLDRIVEFNLGLLEEGLKYEIDGCHFGDDWGQQHGLIMGPRRWRQFLKPRLAKQYAKVKEAGKSVSIHSCGRVWELLPDFIEIGIDVFNPFQPEVIDVFEAKEKYGDRLSFYGGISTQKTLPYGTPDDVKREVRTLIERVGKDGGYILSPAHATPGDVPPENIVALLEAIWEQYD